VSLTILSTRLKVEEIFPSLESEKVFLPRVNQIRGTLVIEFNKISKNPEKMVTMTDMPRPSDVEALSRFLGMVTHYSRFLPK
jgi:hypothetical protein